jgi:light-regulated signal transduction histidine kinase (bacteriophytochrome)
MMSGSEFRVGELDPASCDAALVRQVFSNLLANAVKFTRENDRAIIEVLADERDGERVYIVRDNGVGFEEEQAERMFGVFQRLHGSDRFEGSGVGLAIVQRIVIRHGGRIWAEGARGEGAAFYFTLPAPRHAEP